MRITYCNITEETKERYYLLHKLGVVNYDLKSCIELINNCTSNSPPLILYCSKQLYIHINEAFKYLNKNWDHYKKYINTAITDQISFYTVCFQSQVSSQVSL
jgi:aminopeptidase C